MKKIASERSGVVGSTGLEVEQAFNDNVDEIDIIKTKSLNSDNSVVYAGPVAFDSTAKTISILSDQVLFTRAGFKGFPAAQTITIGSDYYIVYFDETNTLFASIFHQYVDNATNVIIARINSKGTKIVVDSASLSYYTIDGIIYDKDISTSNVLNVTNSVAFTIMSQDTSSVPVFSFVTDTTSTNCQVTQGIFFFFTKNYFIQIASAVIYYPNTTGHYYIYLNTTSNLVLITDYTSAINIIKDSKNILISAFYYNKISQHISYFPFYNGAKITFNGAIWDGNDISINTKLDSLKTITEFKESALNTYSFTFDGSTKTLNITGQLMYFLKNKSIGNNGFIMHVGDVVINFTRDYNYLFYNYITDTYSLGFYQDATDTMFDDQLCIGLFYLTETSAWASLNNDVIFNFNGHTLKSGEIFTATTNTIIYGQLGDSITINDNKYETDVENTDPLLTGYEGWGYGRYLCSALSIPYNDHHVQGKNGRTIADYYDEMVAGNVVFPATVNLYTIFLGTNDWGTERHAIGTQSDYINNTYTTGNRTSYGALRKIIDLLIGTKTTSNLVHPKIVLFTPMIRGAFGYKTNGIVSHYMKSAIIPNAISGEYEYTQNSFGFTLKDISDMIIWVANYEGLHYIDLFNDGIIDRRMLNMETIWTNSDTEDVPLLYVDYLRDNLHPNDKGYKMIASRCLEEIRRAMPSKNNII